MNKIIKKIENTLSDLINEPDKEKRIVHGVKLLGLIKELLENLKIK